MSETLMFDFSSFYCRMAKKLPNECKVIEVGVANGDSVIFLAKELLKQGKKFKIYAVDNMGYGQFIQMKQLYENLIREGVAPYVEVVPYPSLEAADLFNDGYADLIYIDSSHSYPETRDEILKWFPKCKDEGIISGHDYNAPEVRRSVVEVVPLQYTRTDIPDRTFEPENVLQWEETTNGWGLWYFTKQWYLKLNDIK